MASRRDAMQASWERAGLELVETKVMNIPRSSSFDDFWSSTTLPVGPQGKLIDRMSIDEKKILRARLRDDVPAAADGEWDRRPGLRKTR